MADRIVALSIDGPIRGKARVRTNGRRFFKDRKTRKAETGIGWAAKQAMKGYPILVGPLSLDIIIWVAPPKSWSRNKRTHALDIGFVVGKPDWDNIGKLISDALNGIVYTDDSQISDAKIRRRYRENAGADVLVTELSSGWTTRRDLARSAAA